MSLSPLAWLNQSVPTPASALAVVAAVGALAIQT